MRRRLSQAELVEAHAPHIIPLLVAAAASALASMYGAKKQSDAQRNAASASAVGHGQMGSGGFTPSADRFRSDTPGGPAPTGNTKTDAAFQALMGSGPTGTSADPAIMQATATPDAPAPAAASPSFSDYAKGQESAALGTASADPAVSEAANAAATGGTAPSSFDLGEVLPYVQMAAQVGGAISEANRPQPVALHIGRMGGYNSTVPDSVERLRQMLAQQRRGRR